MIGDVSSLLSENFPRSSAGRDCDESGGAGPIVSVGKKATARKSEPGFKRPEGMHRELYNLMTDNQQMMSVMPTEVKKGYRNPKAQIGLRAVRKYVWSPFENEARRDGLKLYHWQRVDRLENPQPYQFARFNKVVNVPEYSSDEYEKRLRSPHWTKEETDYLFDLCRQYDLRWVIIHDRYDKIKFGNTRSIEDIKERFYAIAHELAQSRDPTAEPICFDAEHERRRKEQLTKQWNRSKEDLEEEEELRKQLKIIEARKKERERKAQDLQKLISMTEDPSSPAARFSPAVNSGAMSPLGKKKALRHKAGGGSVAIPTVFFNPMDISVAAIRYPEFKSAGAHLRSHEMKLPSNVGQKKLKNIEVVLDQCKMDLNPMGAEGIVSIYNDFRSHVMLLQELKSTLQTAEFELETLRTKSQENFTIEPRMRVSNLPEGGLDESAVTGQEQDPSTKRVLASCIDISTATNPVVQVRRRKATLPGIPSIIEPQRSRKGSQLL